MGKLKRRIISCIISAVMMLSAMPFEALSAYCNTDGEDGVMLTAGSGANDIGALVSAGYVQGGFSNYSQYMTKHSLKVDGAVIGDGAIIDPSAGFELSLSFKLSLADMAANGLKYYYELPDHITIGDKGSKSEQLALYNSRHVSIGTYYIDDDVIYVEFPGYYDSVEANFSLSASWSDTENRLSVDVPWNDCVEKYIINPCELVVTKQSTGYINMSDDSLLNKFTVRVTPKSDAGDIHDVIFDDVFSVKNLTIDEDYFEGGKAVMLTSYNAYGLVSDKVYYSAGEVITKTSAREYNIHIEGIDVVKGGYFTVTYAAGIPYDKRLAVDCSGSGDNYTNRAKASYFVENPDTGEKQELFSEAKITGKYSPDSEWIMKEAGDATKTEVMDNDTKTIVPYTLNINKRRLYSLGGSCVRDEISLFTEGNVVYYTDSAANTYVEWINSSGSGEIKQKWIILTDSVYNEFRSLVYASGKDTSLERFRKNAKIKAKVLNELNAAEGTSYTEFTDELAAKYVFTDSQSHNFIWLMPLDSEPTSYMIHYDTIVDSQVGDFLNSTSLWFTEYEGIPYAPGTGWVRPTHKVLNATKSNGGVYVGSDGNYYVDFTLTIGLEAGSDAFEDIVIQDEFAYYQPGSYDSKMVMWLNSPDKKLNPDMFDDSNDPAVWNERMKQINSMFTITTDSRDPAVQKLADEAYVIACAQYPTVIDMSDNPTTPELYERMLNDFIDEDHARTVTLCSGNQFVAGSLKSLVFVINDMPATDVGYDIEFKYTMQVNPKLIEDLPGILDEKGSDYITLTNNALVRTSYFNTHHEKEVNLFVATAGGNIYGNGDIQELSSSFWLGIDDTKPGVSKAVDNYSAEKNTVSYDVSVNPHGNVESADSLYKISDMLSVSGMKYVPKSFTLTDMNGNIVWTNVEGKRAASKYAAAAGCVSLAVSNEDHTSSSFEITLDNKDNLFDDGNGKLLRMTLSYSVDTSGFPTDDTIMNTAALVMLQNDKHGEPVIQIFLGESTCEFSIDKALDKMLVDKPGETNGYSSGYRIDINPGSANAKQLKNIRAGESFTVKDTMSENLMLDIDSVKIIQDVNGAQSDITNSCVLKYDYSSGVFEAKITVTDASAKYIIVYNANISTEKTDFVYYTNTVSVLGTDVKLDYVEDYAYVQEYDSSSESYTMEIRLVKFDEYNFTTGLDATFDLYKYNPSDKSWTCITDDSYGYGQIKTTAADNGRVIIRNKVVNSEPVLMIEEGCWYKLVETVSPEGYVKPVNPIYYYVSYDGQVKGRFPNEVSDNYQVMKLAAADDPDAVVPDLYFANHKFSFNIKKICSQTKETLGGSEFTLYADENCSEKIAVVADEDNDGILAFENIEIEDLNAALYLKETRTPVGYIDSGLVYRLELTDGNVTKVTDNMSGSHSCSNSGVCSVITISNLRETGSLVVRKTVKVSGDPIADFHEFTFSINLFDESGAPLEGSFPAVMTSSTGKTEESEYFSGKVFSLQSGTSIMISDLPKNSSYTVTEVADDRFSTSVQVIDTVGTDKRILNGKRSVSGTISAGDRDTVDFSNTPRTALYITKKAVTEDGTAIAIPDGHTINIYNQSKNMALECSAVYNSAAGAYEYSYLANDLYSFDNSLENGFALKNISPSSRYVIREENAAIEGFGYWMSYSRGTHGGTQSKVFREDEVMISPYGDQEYDVILINTYTDNFADVTLTAEKVLENADLSDFAFEFELYDTENDSPIDTAVSLEDGSITFGKLSFTEDSFISGDTTLTSFTNEYIIKEKIPAQAVEQSNGKYLYKGVGYDPTEINVSFTVSLDAAGKISVSEPVYKISGAESEPVFVNTYEAAGEAAFEGTKTLTGRDMEDGEFEFVICQVERDYTTPVTDEDGSAVEFTGRNTAAAAKTPSVISFEGIPYSIKDAGKTYYYIIKEKIPENSNGVDYDDTVFKASVEITDNGDGTLNADVTYPANISFGNVYSAAGSIVFSGKKTMDYKSFEEDEFEFAVTEYTNGSRTTVKKDSKGKPIVFKAGVESSENGGAIKFPTINYTVDDIGYHFYTVSEVAGDKPGIIYDTSVFAITVLVSDNRDGTLSVSITDESSADITFENSYDATADIKFNATKTLLGRDMLTDGEFSFNAEVFVRDNKEDSLKYFGGGLIGSSHIDGSVEILPLTLDASSLGKEYFCFFSEVVPERIGQSNVPGVTYSEQTFLARFYVTDNGDGTLEPHISYYDNNLVEVSSMDFVNTYSAEGSISFTATKLLEGRDLEENQFEFGIFEGDTCVATGRNNADGLVEFTPIRYYIDGSDSYIGTHDYIVREIVPDEPAPGYTYDDSEYSVRVTATDNTDGTLNITVESGADINEAGLAYDVTVPEDKKSNFENSYEAVGSVTFGGTKTLDGRTIDPGEFTFHIDEYKQIDGTPVPTGRTFGGVCGEDGVITFDEIPYVLNSENDGTGLYTYEIREVVSSDKEEMGVGYDKTVHEITVLVSDNGDGTLDVLPGIGSNDIRFANTYDASGSLDIYANKLAVTANGSEYDDAAGDGTLIGNTFDFEMIEIVDGQEIPAGSCSLGVNQTVLLTSFNYTLADIGEHTYIIREIAGTAAGYTYDTTVHTIIVTVSDQRDGTLSVTVTDIDGDPVGETTDGKTSYTAGFTNVYSAEGSVKLTGEKIISNLDKMVAGSSLDGFKFRVYEYDGVTPAVSDEFLVAEGISLADGSIDFADMLYTIGDVGEHFYFIAEDSSVTKSGIINTDRIVYVKVTVSNNGDGTLTAVAEYLTDGESAENAEFVNSSTEVSIKKLGESGKMLAGAVLQIIDQDGNIVLEFTSSSDEAMTVYGLDIRKMYTLHELTAPEGYKLAEDIRFVIGSDGLVYVNDEAVETVEMTDEKINTGSSGDDSPGTGETTSTCAVFALIVLALALRKKRTEE